MREGHEACQISLLYVLFSLFGHDGAQRSMTFLAFCFLFVCLFVVVVVVVFFFFSQRCINLFNQFLNNFLSVQLNQDKLRVR